ncbi:MAG: LuxR C-terminal-related transcriptional regulator [Methylococcaceae bacterium]
MVDDGVGYPGFGAAAPFYLVQSKAAMGAFILLDCSRRGRCDYRHGIHGHAGDKHRADGNIAALGIPSSFLTKPVHDSDLLEAIHDAIEKDRIVRHARVKLSGLQLRLATLTPREREVLSHVVSGKKNRQIADNLGTVEKTIKVHRANLLKNLKVESLADLVKLAEKLGVISSPLD